MSGPRKMTMAKKKKQAEPTVEKPAAEKPKAVKKPKIVIPSVEDLTELIKRAMENQGTYSPDLEFAITNAATNYRLLLIARKDVSKLSKTFYLTYTREGHKDYKEHPLVKTIDRVQSSCSASLKVIGLTLEQLHISEDDPFMKLIEGVNNIGKA